MRKEKNKKNHKRDQNSKEEDFYFWVGGGVFLFRPKYL